ncbi:MAG: ceramidase domain-containing protein [Bosea sp. (in: a-proteobacteria)]|uniref:ceramidase domain-containing protein n=1 Tax=Bosea sp. (in: a-proteobacteria) TaxID=1871050 RepID=UPI002734AA4B|nr:ceramidase domain-containing protein [Bosea sp. (in: a-proteobacteria)]MDP3258339.1 ceramidase domain-containing protein [Bosea sp. (in: a-proteobacteria)]MDP3319272.1 ceramidase domain-containing protein [Bosea sp. (in: a-proteobacteria)]
MLASGYCERIGDHLWDEPWNAITNGAFLLAALAAFLLWRRAGGQDRPVLLLIGFVAAIGIGSFLFHTIPQPWTLAADVVPIQLFAFSYFALALARFVGLGPAAIALGTAAFFVFALSLGGAAAAFLPPGLRGSAGYAAFLLALWGIAALLWRRDGSRQTARSLALAGLVFAVSLTFRTLDRPLCDAIPLGTHWLWHILNALVLYGLLVAAIRHGRAERDAAGEGAPTAIR